MNYCSLQDAWGKDDYISKQYKNYDNTFFGSNKVEKFSSTEKKFKSHVKKIYSCDNFIEHLNKCKSCQTYIRNKYQSKILENFSDLVENNKDIIVLILVGVSIMLFFNLVNSVSHNSNIQK